MLLEMLFSIFLEKTTKKTSRNSSKPSSQTGKDDTALSRCGSKGKGKSETLLSADNTRTVTTIVPLPVENCRCCGESLKDTKIDGCERRTRIDILFEKTVEHFDADIKTCPTCAQITKGEFPSDVYGKLQYGQGIKAFVIHLIISQMVAINRAQKMIAAMIGKRLSEATLLGYILRLHLALETWENAAKEKLLSLPCMYVDETSLKVQRKNHWIHVYSGDDVTLKLLHPKRGGQAIVDNDIIPKYGGVLVHDCWASYLSYKHCAHGLCGSHLLRELTFAVESNNYKWAAQMKKLLQQACKDVAKSKKKILSTREYAKLQKNYRCILTKGKKELPVLDVAPGRKRIAKQARHYPRYKF